MSCGGKCAECTCGGGEKTGPTLGEAAMTVLRGYGSAGATAAEVAAALRAGGFGRPRIPTASTPNVADKLRKYARRGAVKVEYSTSREGDTERPAQTAERFFA